jgi:hypothetical protein
VRVPGVSRLGQGASVGASTLSILRFDVAFFSADAVEGTLEGAPFAGGLVDVFDFEMGAFKPAGLVFAAPDAFEVVGAFGATVFIVDDAGWIADVFDEVDFPGPGVFAIDVADGVGAAAFEGRRAGR